MNEKFSFYLPKGVYDLKRYMDLNINDSLYPRKANGEFEDKFDSFYRVDQNKYKVEYAQIGYVYKSFKSQRFYILLDNKGTLSDSMGEEEIEEHFKFVEAENETEKV